jgi:hypothetical protein
MIPAPERRTQAELDVHTLQHVYAETTRKLAETNRFGKPAVKSPQREKLEHIQQRAKEMLQSGAQGALHLWNDYLDAVSHQNPRR